MKKYVAYLSEQSLCETLWILMDFLCVRIQSHRVKLSEKQKISIYLCNLNILHV